MPILMDSNILIYMFDPGDEYRRKKAVEIVVALGDTGEGCLSAQCISEFYSVVTREKRGNPPFLSSRLAAQKSDELARSFETFPVTLPVVLEAVRGSIRHQIHFWDALIWAAARLNQIPIVFSEDFSDNTTLEGVRFVNPFTPQFQMSEWVG